MVAKVLIHRARKKPWLLMEKQAPFQGKGEAALSSLGKHIKGSHDHQQGT